jgi:hypothetical protein
MVRCRMCHVLRNGTLLCAVTLVVALAASCRKDSCTVPLAESGCAATLDLQIQIGFPNLPNGDCARAGPCGLYRIWTSPPNFTGLTCVYDTSGQRLVSSTACSDVNDFCDRKSFCVSGGLQVNASAVCDLDKLPSACPPTDAGTD